MRHGEGRGGEEVPRTVSETKTERHRGCGRFQLVRDDTVCNASQRENGRHNIRPVEWNKAPHVAIKTASEDVLVSVRTSVVVYRMILCSFWWIFCAEENNIGIDKRRLALGCIDNSRYYLKEPGI